MAGEAPVAQPAEPNPYAAFGLNADGTKIDPPAPPPVDPETRIAGLTAQVASLQKQIAELPSGAAAAETMAQKIIRALGGAPEDAKSGEYKKAWGEIMEIAKVASPAVYKNLERWQADPDYYDRLEGTANALAGARLADLNFTAHETVLGLAKDVFRGASPQQLAEMVLPFEETISKIIMGSPETQRRFAAGDMSVVKDAFGKLIQPHVALRLKQKATLTAPRIGPAAPPRGGGAPAPEAPTRPDIRTPAGKAAFHKAAVGRFLDKAITSE